MSTNRPLRRILFSGEVVPPLSSTKSHTRQGSDESGLGRFSWVKIRGRDRAVRGVLQDGIERETPPPGPKDLVVVSAYRPNLPSAHSGVFGTHSGRIGWNEMSFASLGPTAVKF
mmetsp:Transcript_23158/g.57134  ORF Transcript_23158/g.57134 Transcript_23158/m.57134 type:complete len:114 (-) Transcript_23158:1203-1544(-)